MTGHIISKNQIKDNLFQYKVAGDTVASIIDIVDEADYEIGTRVSVYTSVTKILDRVPFDYPDGIIGKRMGIM